MLCALVSLVASVFVNPTGINILGILVLFISYPLVAFLGAGLVAWDFGDSEILALLFFLMGTAIAAGHVARAEKAQRGD